MHTYVDLRVCSNFMPLTFTSLDIYQPFLHYFNGKNSSAYDVYCIFWYGIFCVQSNKCSEQEDTAKFKLKIIINTFDIYPVTGLQARHHGQVS